MILEIKGETARPIPWVMNEKKSKKMTIIIHEVKIGRLVAIPEIQYCTVIPDGEYPLVTQNRIERPLRQYMELDECKSVARFIVKQLDTQEKAG